MGDQPATPDEGVVAFHISIDGPPGENFPSFPSTDIGGPKTAKLKAIRTRCQISKKLFFTADGRNPINDDTTLAYFMSLSSEGQTILKGTSQTKPDQKPKDDSAEKPKDGEDTSKEAADSAPGVSIFSIKVRDGKTAQPLMALPTTSEAMNKLIAQLGTGGLQRGVLPTFSDRALMSLASDYATTPGGSDLPEPYDLKETQWDAVMSNNRALHGYYFDLEKNILVKATKRAFRLRNTADTSSYGGSDVEVSSNGEDATKQTPIYRPPIPPFYIEDNATVEVNEIRSQLQNTLAREGFNSTAVEGSLGGGQASLPISISASYETEHAWSQQKFEQSSVNSLVAVYNFPRVVVELGPESLELTDECKRDAMNVTDDNARRQFFRTYGTIFATKFSLGGFLHSTRTVTSKEKSTLDQVKDKVRTAAGISIQTPKVSGSMNVAHVESTGEETGSASLDQTSRLTWDARGGDTLLCSNPPAWASTVKNYKLWRLMNQERLISTEYLIRDVDVVAYQQLDNPGVIAVGGGGDGGGDIITDEAASTQARMTLMTALSSPGENALAQKIRDYYISSKLDGPGKIEEYNQFIKKNFPDEESTLITQGTLYGGTTIDQRVGLGLFMVTKGVLRFN
ncbi:hypothetical protein BDZ85DRAFT_97203 [Elsinoe ampelina]|uniref:MACPF-like domain-containing protein n=1 Tax=Elsinoe ampelina TaxID=302913 RepID=A0A6A6GEB2_9PEZI|nr:hypothetical protein BDZ85DRAFT_97203 [Elsinoe ampelina]